jgi:hypothetical protein
MSGNANGRPFPLTTKKSIDNVTFIPYLPCECTDADMQAMTYLIDRIHRNGYKALKATLPLIHHSSIVAQTPVSINDIGGFEESHYCVCRSIRV